MSFRELERRTARLSFVVRFDDPWTGRPVPAAFDLRVDGTEITPVSNPAGQQRQPDGTYRFVDVPDGVWDVHVTDRSGLWAFLDTPIQVTLPLPDPADPVFVQVRKAWPSPARPIAPGRTAVRALVFEQGTLVPVANQRVEMDAPTGGFTRWVRTQGDGECVHLFADYIAPQANGLLDIEVRTPGRVVTTCRVGDAPASVGSTFSLPPGAVSRVRVEVAP